MSNAHPDLADKYSDLSSLYSRKLWHQLTVSSLSFLSDPTALRPTPDTNSHLEYLNKVILPIEKKLNPLSLARMASSVAFSLPDGTSVLSSLVTENESLGPAASLYLESRLGLLQLTLLARSGEALSSPSSMDTLESIR